MSSQESTTVETLTAGFPAAKRTDEAKGGKFLTFFLAGTEYGLEIQKVQELIVLLSITSVPRTPEHILGVINLRGRVIAVVDLRRQFGIEARAQSQQACIIVVKVQGLSVGVLVDQVSEILNIPADEINPAPSRNDHVDANCILGVGRTEGRDRLLLDIDRVLSEIDLITFSEMVQ